MQDMLNKKGIGPNRAVAMAAAAWVTALLAGCAAPRDIGPQSQLRTAQELGATVADARPGAGEQEGIWPPDGWWRIVQDPQLDALMTEALRDAPSMRLVRARFRQAAVQAELAHAVSLPQVGLGASVTHERVSENYLYPRPLAGSVVDDAIVQLKGQWAPDIFGRDAAQFAAAVGAARAADADQAAARWTLSTQIASSYLQLSRMVALREVAQAALRQREHTRELVADRVSAGLDTQVELRQAEGAVPQTRQQLEQIEEQIRLARYNLAALAGRPVHAFDSLTPPLATLALPPVADTLPAELVGHRPDVVAARWRVEAALRGVDMARADFYPNVNLAAFVDFHAIGLDHWLHASSREYGVAPAISLPIFDGGRLRAALRERSAQADGAIETYNQTLLVALKDVADAIEANRSVARQLEQQALAQQAAESAYDLALTRYQAGLGTYLTVLTAEGNVIAQRREAVELKAQTLRARVALVRALGGGYADAVGAVATPAPVPAPQPEHRDATLAAAPTSAATKAAP